MQPTSHAFKANAHEALADVNLQKALGMMRSGFPAAAPRRSRGCRSSTRCATQGKAIKDHVLEHLDLYLETFEAERHRARRRRCIGAARRRRHARPCSAICRRLDAKTVTKGKTMIAEEIALNDYPRGRTAIEPVETDLGEYIIQLRHEPPSHIIAPAIHLVKEQVADTFRADPSGASTPRARSRRPARWCAEARAVLRQKFLARRRRHHRRQFPASPRPARTVIVTNEGNGDLTQTLTKAHIVLASLEKLVPTLEDVATILRLLARSATGQEFSTYTTFSTGPRRPEDTDGPGEYPRRAARQRPQRHARHRVPGHAALHPLLAPVSTIARSTRRSAVMPMAGSIPGRWAAVLTPNLIGIEEAGAPAQRLDLLRPLRECLPDEDTAAQDDAALARARVRAASSRRRPYRVWASGAWAFLAARPPLYRFADELASRVLGCVGAPRGRFRTLPLAGGWTQGRDMPAPEGRSFHESLGRAAQGRSHDRGRAADPGRDPPLAEARARLDAPSRAEIAARLDAHRRATWSRRAPRLSTCGPDRSLPPHGRRSVQTTVTRVASAAAEVPGAVADYLSQRNLPSRLVMTPDPQLDGIPWSDAAAPRDPPGPRRGRRLDRRHRLLRRRGRDRHADADFGPGEPDAQQLPARHHLVVMRRDQVVATYEDGFDRLRALKRAADGSVALPRTSISSRARRAPAISSRSIELGAHGPRRLHIILIDEG